MKLKADCSSFDWKKQQMAIGETPSEPLIALMNTDIPKAAARLLSDPLSYQRHQ